jgi:hypothetical protein
MPILFEENITRGQVRRNSDRLYVFGDNLEQKGKPFLRERRLFFPRVVSGWVSPDCRCARRGSSGQSIQSSDTPKNRPACAG